MFECVEEVGVEKLAVSLCHGAARVRFCIDIMERVELLVTARSNIRR